jgi:DNA-binding Lrp family transcriptional regulator
VGALDPIDWQLLSLMADAVAPAVASLATAAGISEADATTRIERLRESGVIASIQARVAPDRVGLPITAFFLVRVAQTEDSYQAIDHLIREFDQVQEAHAVSGQYDWIIKVRATDPEDLRNLLTRRLALLPGFVRAETLIVLSTALDAVNVEAASRPK